MPSRIWRILHTTIRELLQILIIRQKRELLLRRRALFCTEQSKSILLPTQTVSAAASFADEVTSDLRRGTPTPAFTGGTPTHSGYTFTGWSPAVAATGDSQCGLLPPSGCLLAAVVKTHTAT